MRTLFNKAATFILFLMSVFLPLQAISRADMGRIYATDAQVSEESQKAIILHNLEEEVLILGTDLKADKKTGIIRFIPFPSEPKVSLAPAKAFEAVTALIKSHGLKFVEQTRGGQTSTKDVELRFNQKLGAHDITIIKINNSLGFRNWVNEFFKKKGLPQKDTYPAIEDTVDDYVKRGMVYFVFDFVEVTDQTRFIEPVQYRFKSKELYYPIKTSNTFGGIGGIDLILISPKTVCEPLNSYYFGCLGLQNMRATTSSQVTTRELKDILPDAGTFYGKQNIFIQLSSYHGKYEFEKDIFADLSKALPYAVGHAEQVEGNPWIFPMEDIIKDIKERFPTEEKDNDDTDRCKLRPDPGPCKGLFEKYYFDATKGSCEVFFYGGCGGVVPFETMEECESLCIKASSDKKSSIKSPGSQEYISEGDYFRCVIPDGWEKWESYFGLSQKEKKVYGIDTMGLGIEEGLRARISVHYYAEGNTMHETADRFIEVHSKPVFGIAIEGSKYGPVTETIVAGRKAKTFERQTLEFIDHVYDPKTGRYYTPIDPKKIPVIEKFIVIPAKEGYYTLRYYAHSEIAEVNIKAFEEVVNSFRPNVE